MRKVINERTGQRYFKDSITFEMLRLGRSQLSEVSDSRYGDEARSAADRLVTLASQKIAAWCCMS